MIQNLTSYTQAAQWLRSKTRGELSVDSRRVKPGDAFVAWPGYAHDGRAFVRSAIDAGALACLVEEDGVKQFNKDWDAHEGIVASYKGLKAAGGFIADAYYEQPSSFVKVLAVTGTNGKTSITWWLSAALSRLGSRCGVIGTLGVGEVKASNAQDTTTELLNNFVANGLTTPDPLTLHQSLKAFKEGGIDFCALEASSIGIVEHRLNGTKINTAIFTNLSRDHLDYHKDMEDYWNAKSSLFDSSELVCAVINVDDPKGMELSERLNKRFDPKLTVIRVSELGRGDLNATEIMYPNERGGIGFQVNYKAPSIGADQDPPHPAQSARIDTNLVGRYNVSNLLCVIATLCQLGYSLEEVLKACEEIPPVAGRMQRINPNDSDNPVVIVDYAHTPDALEKALESLKPLAKRGAQLHCLVGCGGDRDKGKRPEMALVAFKNADKVMFTSDNPRTEQAQSIVEDMLKGIAGLGEISSFNNQQSPNQHKISVELDRALAIQKVIGQARSGDIVLLAGKGHEDYQDINGIKSPFSDVQQAKQALAKQDGRSNQL